MKTPDPMLVQVANVLDAAAALILHEDSWCQGAAALSWNDEPCLPTDPSAAKWCLIGGSGGECVAGAVATSPRFARRGLRLDGLLESGGVVSVYGAPPRAT